MFLYLFIFGGWWGKGGGGLGYIYKSLSMTVQNQTLASGPTKCLAKNSYYLLEMNTRVNSVCKKIVDQSPCRISSRASSYLLLAVIF